MVGVTHVTVSRWRNGKHEISDYHARKIKDAFPEYDFAEIIGLADAFNAENIAQAERYRTKNKLLTETIALAFPGDVKSLAIEKDFDPWDYSILRADYKFTHNGKSFTLSGIQMEQFRKEICGYIEMRLNQMLERGAW